MEKEYKGMTYVGEIIDRSWFDDPEAYEEGTYEPIPVDWSGPGWEVINGEFYQGILRPNRVYLDEYPECIPEPKCILLSEHYGVYEHCIKRFMRRN